MAKSHATAQMQKKKKTKAVRVPRAAAGQVTRAVVALPTKSKAGARTSRPQAKKAPKAIPNFLDPMCPVPAPTLISNGRALAHTGLVSIDFVVGTTNRTLFLATNTGNSGSVGILMTIDPNGARVVADPIHIFTIPTLSAPDSGGGPSAARAMKLGVTVINCSNALKRGGRVSYINSSQRLPARTANSYLPVIDGIKNSPYRRRITGDSLITPLQLLAFPVDTTSYHSFGPFHGTLDADEFLDHVLGAGIDSPAQRPMSVIAYVFEPVSDPQDYSATIRASYYTRWPLTTVPGQSMHPIRTAAASTINVVHDHVESTANDLVHVAEGGLAATVGPRLLGLGRSAATGLMRGMGQALGAVEGVAAEAIGAEGVAAAELAIPLLL